MSFYTCELKVLDKYQHLFCLNNCFWSTSSRLVAAYEEQQKLQKESESLKRKAENGYDR